MQEAVQQAEDLELKGLMGNEFFTDLSINKTVSPVPTLVPVFDSPVTIKLDTKFFIEFILVDISALPGLAMSSVKANLSVPTKEAFKPCVASLIFVMRILPHFHHPITL